MRKPIAFGAALLVVTTVTGLLWPRDVPPAKAPRVAARSTRADVQVLQQAASLAARAEASPRVDVDGDRARVAEALARFHARLDKITKEDLEAEQVRVAAAKERFLAVETPEPARERIVDDNGQEWVKLSFPSGEVRYELPL
jgi:hypothetical protein